ncbi:B-cell receptor CD22-like isoform X2 [Trachinotus anak]
MVTVSILLSVLFVTGASASCIKPHLVITAPERMEALSGSCLQIPCNFRVNPEEKFSAIGTIFGVWIKNDPRFAIGADNVIFNGSHTVNIYPISITGNLSQKNCTTLFSHLTTHKTEKYFFRIENGAFKATAACYPLEINVNDSPMSPKIEISGNLKEEESVTVTCSAFSPCPHSPPKLTWNLKRDPRNKIEENKDQTFSTKIQETITLSDKWDGRNIACSASYPVNEGKGVKTADNKMTLSVSYAPKDTRASISPSRSVSAGSWVNLTCSSRAKPPISRFTWYKQSTDGPTNVSEGDFYNFRVTHGGVYYCVATNGVGYQNSLEIHLSVEGETLYWEPVLGGVIGFILLICLIVFVWHLKSTHSTPQQTQGQRGDELAVEESAGKREEENIHYGEIDFSKLRPEPSSDSLQDSGRLQDTVYAEVKVSKTVNGPTHAADSPEDLYARVMRK